MSIRLKFSSVFSIDTFLELRIISGHFHLSVVYGAEKVVYRNIINISELKTVPCETSVDFVRLVCISQITTCVLFFKKY